MPGAVIGNHQTSRGVYIIANNKDLSLSFNNSVGKWALFTS